MAYMGSFRPKGVPFSALRYIKGLGFHKLRYIKGYGNWSLRYLKGPLIIIFRADAPYGCISLFIIKNENKTS